MRRQTNPREQARKAAERSAKAADRAFEAAMRATRLLEELREATLRVPQSALRNR